MKRQTMPTLSEAYSRTLYGGNLSANGQIVEINPSELVEITDQPFHPYKSDKLSDLAESIRNNGQQQPCIVRKLDDKYIVLAGRNRKRACELAGCKVKCIIRECSDADADLILTETNLYQRQELLPSELAKGYKMQKLAYEAKGSRKSTAAIAAAANENIKTIQRYIKLADLHPALLDLVDAQQIPVMAGVVITKASAKDQKSLLGYLQAHPAQRVSLAGSQRLVLFSGWDSDKLSHFFSGNSQSDGKGHSVTGRNQDKVSDFLDVQRSSADSGQIRSGRKCDKLSHLTENPAQNPDSDKNAQALTYPQPPCCEEHVREQVPAVSAHPVSHETLNNNESTAADVDRQIEEITTGLYLLSDMLKKSGVDMGNTIDKFIETMHKYHDQVDAGK